MAQTCPTLANYSAGDDCLENIAGMGEVAYIGLRKELKKALTATDNTYSLAAADFADGANRLVKVDLKAESQKISAESQGKRKGFNLVATLVFDAVNKDVSKLARALNNLDIFIIMPDGDEAQILYDPNKKIRIESGGLTSDTGAAAGDDRVTTANLTLGPVKYPSLFVTVPEGGFDTLVGPAPTE